MRRAGRGRWRREALEIRSFVGSECRSPSRLPARSAPFGAQGKQDKLKLRPPRDKEPAGSRRYEITAARYGGTKWDAALQNAQRPAGRRRYEMTAGENGGTKWRR